MVHLSPKPNIRGIPKKSLRRYSRGFKYTGPNGGVMLGRSVLTPWAVNLHQDENLVDILRCRSGRIWLMSSEPGEVRTLSPGKYLRGWSLFLALPLLLVSALLVIASFPVEIQSEQQIHPMPVVRAHSKPGVTSSLGLCHTSSEDLKSVGTFLREGSGFKEVSRVDLGGLRLLVVEVDCAEGPRILKATLVKSGSTWQLKKIAR